MVPDTENPNEPDDIQNPADSGQSAEDAEFAALLEQHLPAAGGGSSRGEPSEVTVVAVREDTVLVDMGGKAEAVIPIEEFPLVGGVRKVQKGDIISVVQSGRNEDGSPRVSHKAARSRQAKKNVADAFEHHVPLRGVITQVIKGGVMVDVGLDAFMPASQVDLFKIPDLNSLVGQEIEAYVLEFDQRRNRAVLTRRQLLFERRQQQRDSFLHTLQPGETVKGKVKSCLDFGAFIDLGMVDGFVPREEVSWDRGRAPQEVLKPGEEVEVKILNVSSQTGKITLSRKRLQENPWDLIAERYPAGSTVRGEVVAIQNYGAFVHIEEGITGMIHATDMSWSSGNKKPEDYVRVGDVVTSQVIEVDKEKRRLSLGLKQLSRDPWAAVEEKYQPGTRHKGTVTSLTNYGAFVKLDDFIEGMVHVSDISWEKRVNHPKDFLKVGDEVDVVVLKTDSKDRRVSLGIKQVQESPFDQFLKENKVGSVIKGTVTRFAPFGAFVDVGHGLEGLIHISQIDEKRVELPENALRQGEEVLVKIISVEKKNQKISLSRKEAIRTAEKENIKAYLKKKDDQPGGMSFGEALKSARERQESN